MFHLYLNVGMQGVELDDFVSGPRELLLKLVEEHYPLPSKSNHAAGQYFSLVLCNYVLASLL